MGIEISPRIRINIFRSTDLTTSNEFLLDVRSKVKICFGRHFPLAPCVGANSRINGGGCFMHLLWCSASLYQKKDISLVANTSKITVFRNCDANKVIAQTPSRTQMLPIRTFFSLGLCCIAESLILPPNGINKRCFIHETRLCGMVVVSRTPYQSTYW